MQQIIQKPKRLIALSGLVLLCVLSVTFGSRWQKTAHAACPAPAGQYGSVNFSNVNVPTKGTYRLWVRINAPSTVNNSVAVDVGGSYCGINMGDKSDMPTGSWQWVDYKAGDIANKADLTLDPGTYTLALSGREPDVSIDRVLLVGDTTCQPTGDGSNCLTDNTPPSVSLTSPAAGNATGTVNITADATDARGVSKVEFYANNTLINTDVSAPYSFAWDTTLLTNQQYTLTAKAYDTSGNVATSTSRVVTVVNPPTVSVTSPVNNAILVGTVNFTANASSQTGIAKVEFYVNSTSVGTLTASPYTLPIDTRFFTDGTYTILAKAYDNSGVTSTASVQVQILNKISPMSVVVAEDTFVKDGKSYINKSFDAQNRLRVSDITNCTKNCGTQYNRNSYLKFNITGLKAAPKTITLKLYVSDSSNDGGSIYKVNTNNWSENTMTWSNAPAISTQKVAQIGAVNSGRWISVTIDPTAITQDGTYSFAISNDSSDVAAYMSMETSTKPTLEFTF